MNEQQQYARSFVAVMLPLELAAMLNKKARHHVGEDLANRMRWVGPQQYHITLRFLGDVQVEQLKALAKRLRYRLLDWQSFHGMTGSYQLFPNNRRPRVMGLEVHSGGCLQKLHELVEEEAQALGFPVDNQVYRPHVTLARFTNLHNLSGRPAWSLPGFKLTVSEICVMKSNLSENGPRYQILERIPFADNMAESISTMA